MKKLLTLALLLSVCLRTWADKWTDGNGISWTYTVSGTNATNIKPTYTSDIFGTVMIPSSIRGYTVTSIGRDAFRNCTNLMSVTIPSSVTSIGSTAFYGCSGLKKVIVPNIVAWCNISFVDAYSNPLYFARHLYSNEYTEITDLVIPESVTSIGCYTFNNLIFNSVTINPALMSFLSQQVEEDYDDEDYYYRYRNSIYAYIKANHYIIGEGVTSIGDGLFYGGGNVGITTMSVTIPSTVTSIGKYAFYGCSNLTNITIPSSVMYIGQYAFYGCSNLTNITIPSSVTRIGDYAFYSCSGLTSVTIPSSVMYIGQYAFRGCSSLTSVTNNSNAIMSSYALTFGSQVKNYIIGEGVTSIGYQAFRNCTNLMSVTIPSSVTSIGSSAFSGCDGLTKVIVPDIAAWCNIRFVDYSSNPLYYAKHLYSDENTEITDLVIPEGVTSIGSYAFYGCTGLSEMTKITIPESVTSIGDNAFYTLSGLTTVNCEAFNPPVINENTFSCYENATLFVPGGCTRDYEAANYWENFYNILTVADTIDNTLYLEPVEGVAGLQKLISVKMKNTVPIVGYQFTLALPEGVTVATDSEGFPKAELSEERTTKRKTNYFGTTIQADGTLKVLCTTTAGTNGLLYAFDGNDGEVARIKVNIPEEMSAGDYPLLLQNVRLTGQSNEHYSINSLRSNLHVAKVDFLPGDVNGDGEVDVADFTVMANYILGKTPEVFIKSAADIAGGPDGSPDDEIDVADLTGIANIILHGNGGLSGAPRRAAVTPTDIDTQDNAIYVEPLTAMPGTQQVLSVRMKNNVDVSGMEFTLQLPEGITIATDADGIVMAGLSNERTTARKTDFFAGSPLGDGMLKVLCASTKENPGTGKMFTFDGYGGAVAHFTVNIPADYEEGTYSVSVTNAKTSDPYGVKTTLADSDTSLNIGSATGISHTSDLTPVSSGDYYTLDGQKLEKRPAKKGVYIHNGIKVVVK